MSVQFTGDQVLTLKDQKVQVKNELSNYSQRCSEQSAQNTPKFSREQMNDQKQAFGKSKEVSLEPSLLQSIDENENQPSQSMFGDYKFRVIKKVESLPLQDDEIQQQVNEIQQKMDMIQNPTVSEQNMSVKMPYIQSCEDYSIEQFDPSPRSMQELPKAVSLRSLQFRHERPALHSISDLAESDNESHSQSDQDPSEHTPKCEKDPRKKSLERKFNSSKQCSDLGNFSKSSMINQKRKRPSKLEDSKLEIYDLDDEKNSPSPVNNALSQDIVFAPKPSMIQIKCSDMLLMRYYEISTQPPCCEGCNNSWQKIVEGQVFVRQKSRDLLFVATCCLNFVLIPINASFQAQSRSASAKSNTIFSCIFFVAQLALELTRRYYLNLDQTKIHLDNLSIDRRYLQDFMARQESTQWQVLRYAQLAIALLGIQILVPNNVDDLNQEFRLMAINENMGKVSLLVGMFYALIFQESSVGAVVIQVILSSNQFIGLAKFNQHFSDLQDDVVGSVNGVSWTTYLVSKLLEICFQLAIISTIRTYSSMADHMFLQCSCTEQQPSAKKGSSSFKNDFVDQNVINQSMSMKDESMDYMVKRNKTEFDQLKNVLLGSKEEQVSKICPSSQKIDNPDRMSSNMLSVAQISFHQNTNRMSGIQTQHQQFMEILFDYLNKSSMLCKIWLPEKNSPKQRISSSIGSNSIQNMMKSFIDSKFAGNMISLEVLRITQDFFDGIPESKNPRRNESSPIQVEDNLGIKKYKTSTSKKVQFTNITQMQQDQLSQKIYIPYFISNSTIIEFEKQEANEKLSLMDIVNTYFNSQKYASKYYFKVVEIEEESESNDLCPASPDPRMNKSGKQEGKMDQFYEHKENSATKNRMQDIENQIQYFEVEFKQIVMRGEKHYLIMVRDLTSLIKSQQKLSDDMYQDAIESNYSHEQMTPLNCILAQSKIVSKRYLEAHKHLKEYFKLIKDENGLKQQQIKGQETLKILQAVEQSGQAMWFYNTNQIQRMKIRKNEFKQQLKVSSNPDEHIQKVIYPFEPHITKQGIKVHFAKKNDVNLEIKANWIMYQLILFNIIQNSVKYNQFNGDIIILTECVPISQDPVVKIKSLKKKQINASQEGFNYMFETHIIDTGIGIEEDRQKMLFIPFLELKMKQNIKQVKDNNIGMGLACSEAISSAINGDITIKHSRRGLTVFAFKIPVKVNENSQKELVLKNYESGQDMYKNYKISRDLKDFLSKKEVKCMKRFEFENIDTEQSNQVDQAALNSQAIKKQQELMKMRKSHGRSPSIAVGQNIGLFSQNNSSFKNQSSHKKLIEPVESSVQSYQKGFSELSDEGSRVDIPIKKSPLANKEVIQSKSGVSNDLKMNSSLNNQPLNGHHNRLVNQSRDSQNLGQFLAQQPPVQKTHRSSSVADFSLSMGKLQNLSKLQKKAQEISRNNLLNESQNSLSLFGGLDGSSENFSRSKAKSKPGQAGKNRHQYDDVNNLAALSNDSNQEIIDQIEKIEEEEKAINEQIQQSDEQIDSSSQPKIPQNKLQKKSKKMINNKSQPDEDVSNTALNVGQGSHYNTLLEQQKMKIPGTLRDAGPIHKSSSKMKIIGLQNPMEQKYQDKNISSLASSEKKELAKNLLLQNQKNSLLQQMKKYSKSDQSDGFIIMQKIWSEKSDEVELEEQSQQESAESEYSEVRDINVDAKKRIRNRTLNLSNSSYSDSSLSQELKKSKQKEEVKQPCSANPEPNRRISSSIEQASPPPKPKMLGIINSQITEKLDEDKDDDSSQSGSEGGIIQRGSHKNFQQPKDREEIKEEDKEEEKHESPYRIDSSSIPQEIVGTSCHCQPRILVVDDTSFNIMAVRCMIFENFQLGIDEAINGKIAYEMFKEGFDRKCGCPDRAYKFIVMDIQMPIMDGIEASTEIMKLVREDQQARLREPSKSQSFSKAISNYVQSQKDVESVPSSKLSKMLSVISKDLLSKLVDNVNQEENKEAAMFLDDISNQELTHIVALTSYTNEKVKADCYAAGIKRVINKPLKYKTLHYVMWKHYFRIDLEEYKPIYKSAFNQSFEESDSEDNAVQEEEKKQQ